MAIILLLLALNVASNYVLSRVRASKREAVTNQMHQAALTISRETDMYRISGVSRQDEAALRLRHNLSGVVLLPSSPPDAGEAARRRWFVSVARILPPQQLPELAEKLVTSDLSVLRRGRNQEYFYVYAVTSRPGGRLMILSRNIPSLAYLDDACKVVFGVSVFSVLMVASVYLLLSRHILAPFKRIRLQARSAGRPVTETADEVEAVVKDYHDIISELKQKEAELTRLNQAMRRRADSLEEFNDYLLRSVSSGVVIIDATGKILSVNDAASHILEEMPTDFVGRPYQHLFPPDSELHRLLRMALDQQLNTEYVEVEFLRSPSGQQSTLGVTASVIRNALALPVGISLLLNDLTEVKRLRKDLETKTRLAALGEMAGGLAHQLRNSIGAIAGYGKLVRRRLGDRQTDGIEALLQETREAEQLVDRFLQFARPLDIHPKPVNLRLLLEELVASYRVRSQYDHIDFELEAPDTPVASADGLLLKQALTNIVDNAVNAYEGSSGGIQIVCRGAEGEVSVVVKDHGCGIAPADLDNIFTPFYSSRPSGTGLGLPLAARIVDLHHGRLLVDSQIGQGTTFTIVLPVSVAAEPVSRQHDRVSSTP